MTRFLIALIGWIAGAAGTRRAVNTKNLMIAPPVHPVAQPEEARARDRALEARLPERPRISSCEVYEVECVRCPRPAAFLFETPKARTRVVLLATNHVFGHAKYVGEHLATTAGLVDWFRGCPVCFARDGTAGELLFSGLERIDLVLCACGWAGSVDECTWRFPSARATAAGT
jgi:hypothetical protein